MPPQDEIAQFQGKFNLTRGFPQVTGAIDGTRIPIKSRAGV